MRKLIVVSAVMAVSLALAGCMEGEKGAKGDKGDKGEIGAAGPAGPAGAAGLPGKDGKDGANGKDGASIRIVTNIGDDASCHADETLINAYCDATGGDGTPMTPLFAVSNADSSGQNNVMHATCKGGKVVAICLKK